MDSLNLGDNSVFTGTEDSFFKPSDLDNVGGLGDDSNPSAAGILSSIIGNTGGNSDFSSGNGYNFSERLNLGSGAEAGLSSPRGGAGYGADGINMQGLNLNGAPASPGGGSTAAAPPTGSPAPAGSSQNGAPQAVQAGAPVYVQGGPQYAVPPAQYATTANGTGAPAPNGGAPVAGAPAATAATGAPASGAPAGGAAPVAVAPQVAGMQGQPGQANGQPYYVQQPIYVDQNGQPIYYQQQMQQQVDANGQPIQVQYSMPPQYQQPQYVGPDGQPIYAQPQGGRGYQQRYDQPRYDNKYDDRSGGNAGGNAGGGGNYDDSQRGGYRNDRRNDRNDRYDSYRDRYDDRRGGDRRGNDRYGDRGGRDPREGANPGRDPLVDEFRNTFGKSRQWGLTDLLGHVVAFCQDQHGSRFIQQRLEVCNDEEKQLVFEEILLVANPLMTDVFGNYVLQKLFEYGTPDQCEQLGLLLAGQAVNLAMQMYGCRVVQKALEYVNTERLMALVSEFESPPVLLRCVHDSNGNHVIQKCIEIVSRVAADAAEHSKEAGDHVASRIQFIIDTFKGRVKELSSHPYGCRVVQRILEHCPNEQKSVILEELRQCCADLVQDCYGNYVIQFVMQHGWEQDRAVLIREVQANLLDFSQHKFASNVVEKCLQYASRRDRDEMIWTIINVTFDMNNPVDSKGHCVLESMVRDPYANYVVQKVIDVSDERQRAAILRYVRENINQLRRYTYGKHIIVRLEKLTNEKF